MNVWIPSVVLFVRLQLSLHKLKLFIQHREFGKTTLVDSVVGIASEMFCNKFSFPQEAEVITNLHTTSSIFYWLKYTFIYLIIYLFSVCMHVHVSEPLCLEVWVCAYHGNHMEVRGQLVRVASLLLSCMFWQWNSGCHVWQS